MQDKAEASRLFCLLVPARWRREGWWSDAMQPMVELHRQSVRPHHWHSKFSNEYNAVLLCRYTPHCVVNETVLNIVIELAT